MSNRVCIGLSILLLICLALIIMLISAGGGRRRLREERERISGQGAWSESTQVQGNPKALEDDES